MIFLLYKLHNMACLPMPAQNFFETYTGISCDAYVKHIKLV